MRDYVIITDSCCDLSEQLANDAGLYVIPMVMTISGKEYKTILTSEKYPQRLFTTVCAPERLPLPRRSIWTHF